MPAAPTEPTGGPTAASEGPAGGEPTPEASPSGPDPWSPRRLGETLALYSFLAIAFAGAALAIEVALGDPLRSSHGGPFTHDLEDAAWHLATGLALALPTRRRGLILTMPFLTLAIDLDHVFGVWAPTVVGRDAHNLLFLALAVGVTYQLLGRAPAVLAAAATVLHLSVDGGGFPFLAPVSLQTWSLPAPVAVAGVGLAAVLIATAARPLAELLRPRYAVPTLIAVAGVVVVGTFVPWVPVFNGV